MIIYFGDSGKLNETILDLDDRSGILHSYFYLQAKKVLPPYKFFLDSGAFSAFTQNTQININQYIQFILDNGLQQSIYANLDVIGNSTETWRNQKRMEKAGLHPLPVYHSDDKGDYLDFMLDNYRHFAIGGMAKTPYTQRRLFLDRVFQKIKNSNKSVKIHGFGLTDLDLICRYPWHSVDSTTHNVAARFGESFFIDNNNKINRICISILRKKEKRNIQHSPYILRLFQKQVEALHFNYSEIISNTEIRALYNAKLLLHHVNNNNIK